MQMGTGVYGFTDIQGPRPTKVAHKMHLVTPRMDVDVTGAAFKRMRTQIIDHPRDEGLKQREQLWNYQQRYRGAIGKLKSITTSGITNSEEQLAGDSEDNLEEETTHSSARRISADKTSLQTRFRKRLSSKLRIASLRQSELYIESRTKGQTPTEKKEEDKSTHPGIERLYSSGLIVKNSIYKQIRHGENSDERRPHQSQDNSRILEAIEKFGSLEKLPDISLPNPETPVHHSLRTLKSLSSYSRRFIEQASQDRRITPLQRAQTITVASRPAMKKIFIIGKRNNHTERLVRIKCIDTEQDDEDDDNDGDDEDYDDDDEKYLDDDYEDECDNENRRGLNKKQPDHIAIRNNITSVNTQDDLALIQARQSPSEGVRNCLRNEKTFHVNTNTSDMHTKISNPNSKPINRVYKDFVSSATVMTNPKNQNNVNSANRESSVKNTSSNAKGENSKEKDNKIQNKEKDDKYNRKGRVKCSSRKDKTDKVPSAAPEEKENESNEKDDKNDSDDSLDIPKERVGHTTHSIERKLSIRKPWEWKPSPFRWIDKPYVRESDKPYIERVLNRGEIIDEFNYDSYARTKPLKVQSYPEHAGYKDRYGVMR